MVGSDIRFTEEHEWVKLDGDIVVIGGVMGKVTRIRVRATTITDWDNRELIVPNKDLVTGQIINRTLSNTIARLVFPITIAYGSDIDQVRTLLLRIAEEHPLVSREPGPSANLVGFGANGLEVQLRLFIADGGHYAEVETSVNKAIHDELRQAGIRIVVPQRELHVHPAESDHLSSISAVVQCHVIPYPTLDPRASPSMEPRSAPGLRPSII